MIHVLYRMTGCWSGPMRMPCFLRNCIAERGVRRDPCGETPGIR